MNLILLIHQIFASVILGFFLYKQFVQYPLFKKIARNQYPVFIYHLKQRQKFPELILLFAEGATAVMLFISPPDLANPIYFQTNLMLLGMVWIYKYQLENEHLHQLNTKFSLEKHRKLVKYHIIAVLISTLRVATFGIIITQHI